MPLELLRLETSFDPVAAHGDGPMDSFCTQLVATATGVERRSVGTDVPGHGAMRLGLRLPWSVRDLDRARVCGAVVDGVAGAMLGGVAEERGLAA
jgi:hypothetical protein